MNSVNVSCDDKVVKLYNIVIVSFCPFTLIVECIVVSMFKDLLFDVCWSVFHWDMIDELFWDYNPIKCHCLCKGNDLILWEWISTCELQNVCGLGMNTSHCVIVCNWCISMATLGSIWNFFICKGWTR
jgi:hypothetical protein